jgi:chromosome segregation protein
LEEVGRQVNSLKRQAAKTKRYGELRTEMVAQLRQALTGRYRMLEREAAKTALDLNLATSEFQALSAEVADKEKDYSQVQEQCYRTEASLTDSRKQFSDLQLEQERTRGKLDYQAKQIAGIEQRLGQGETESQDLDVRHAQQSQELERHLAALGELESQTESARQRLASKTGERERLQQALQERNRTLESGRQQVLRLLGESSTLKNQLAQIEEYLSGVDRDTARSQREEETAQSDLERLARLKEELSKTLDAQQLQLQSVAEQRKSVDAELGSRKSKLNESRRQLEQLRGEASRLKARKDSLEEVISHRSYTTESVKRFFTAIERGQAQMKPVGVLADFVEVDSTYEKATEEFLHEELEYVVVNDWSEAERGIDLMRTDLDGRATFLVHPQDAEPASEARIEGEGLLGKLTDYLRFTNGLTKAPADLIPRLNDCYLAADRAAAQQLSVQYPGKYFLLPDGISYHGHAVSGGKKKGSGPLGLKRELREIRGQVQSKQAAVDETAKRIDSLEKEIAHLTEEMESLRSLQQNHERQVLALDHENRKLMEEHHRSTSRLSVARMDLDRLRKESERAHGQRERNLQLVEEKELARGVQEQVLEQSRADLEELQTDSAKLTEEHSGLRADLAGLEERRRAEKAAQIRFEAQLREMAKRREELAREMERLGAERTRLQSDNVGLNERAVQLSEEIARVDTVVRQLAEEETSFRAKLAALEDSLKNLRQQAQTAQEKRSQVELDLVRRQSELKFLDETSRKELNTPVEELAAQEETVLDDAGLEEAEARYQELRAKIEALGPVNADALQEFQEATQRHEFLNAQRTDLLDSIRDTEKAIQDIDVESRKRFMEAYQVINNNFREMFKTLFGGGIGEMRLTDEENINESGIDIVASPPGKKLQNVLLLSGGEKSLTAMALLMAIFQYQPSPFCILDEVDAPLDEPNIERLTRMLRDMSEQTQFIVITHAKRTMEAAQSLYGVTMQEPGVSKLVSVRFQPIEPAQIKADLVPVGAN